MIVGNQTPFPPPKGGIQKSPYQKLSPAPSSQSSAPRPKLLFLVTEDWYFCSHRLPLARAALDAGFDVSVATRVRSHGKQITAAGINLIPLSLQRSGRNPLREMAAIYEIARIYRRIAPDIVHHVAMKPVLYGSLAAKITGVPVVINALAGMGYVFTSNKPSAKRLRPLITLALRLLLKNSRVILQNPDDRATLIAAGVLKEKQVTLIRGSGVDTKRFHMIQESDDTPLVVLAARMLWDKGVGEFISAARQLKDDNVKVDFVLAGEIDPDNPAHISRYRLQTWHDSGYIEWAGKVDDMEKLLARANIVCLPSYREGLPKVLLEAASCGRAIVATNVPGCREAVHHNENGLLVPVRNSDALAAALRRLIENPSLRHQFGLRGREMAEKEFSLEKITGETLALYRKLLP